MIPRYKISIEDLSVLKHCRISQENSVASYTELWLTPNGKSIVKLYSNDDSVRYGFAADIENDIRTILALSEEPCLFNTRFVLPEAIYQCGSKIIGYSMPYVQGIALSKSAVSMKKFKQIIQQLYADVLFINTKTRYSFADLHEDNIILDKAGQLHHIDTDGWYCGDGKGRRSRYLSYHGAKLALCAPKYQLDNMNEFIPNIDTDLFCLMQIVLNYLLQTDGGFASLLEYEQEGYFQYISDRCNCPELARMYNSFFRDEDSSFDVRVIQSLPEDIELFSYDEFVKKTAKFKTDTEAEDFLRQQNIRLNQMFFDRETNFQT